MSHFKLTVRTVMKSNKGQGLIEYLILVAVIAVGALVSVKYLGQSLNVKLTKVSQALGAQTNSNVQKVNVDSTATQLKDMNNFMNQNE